MVGGNHLGDPGLHIPEALGRHLMDGSVPRPQQKSIYWSPVPQHLRMGTYWETGSLTR